ncbi:MAG: carbohydrate transporter permease [Paenibacillaceae bacterium]|jgi:multiple sugar transport system permease protein/putative aldouronate transport system permease protein|nr:carbohydrate transporter permease [Paenibacillaceae bacterium]
MNAKVREPMGDRWFNAINLLVLGLFFLTVLYPLIFIISSSISDADAVVSGRVWLWPVGFSLEGYKAVFEYHKVWVGFANSLFYASVGTLFNVAVTILAAYPLSRKGLSGRNLIMFLFVFTMLFNGGLIPTYLLVKDIGLLNTRWALIIPEAMSVFNMIVMRTYFQTSIPHELLEASQIDGCNDFRFLWKIVLPLSAPILAVITLFYAVEHWNEYFNALIYLNDERKYPLQLFLRQVLIQNSVDTTMLDLDIKQAKEMEGLKYLLKYGLIVVSSIPLIVAYPFVQKHFVKGLMIGSLKG